MQTRRDQVRAYRFVTRRIVSALLSGEPETTELPMRRLGLALLASIMVAAIVFAGVGVYGLLNPGGGTPGENSLVIERETGARYVYVDNVLYPVLNFASARLILGADATTQTMSQRSLRGLARGRQVGIVGAPDSLPERGALLGLPWTVCSTTPSDAVSAVVTQLLVGEQPAAGAGLADDAVLVSTDDSSVERYLLWHNRRMRIKDGATLAALRLSGVPVLPVGQPLLNAVTSGPDLVPLVISNSGRFSTRTIKGGPARVGQIYHVGAQHYVLTSSGLAAIGEVSALLLLATGGDDQELTAEQAGPALLNLRLDPEGFPEQLPQMRTVDAASSALCAEYRGGDGGQRDVVIQVLDAAGLRSSVVGDTTGGQISGGVRVADRVVVAGGRGALVRAVPATGATVSNGLPTYLVTDQGLRYAFPTTAPEAQAALGYQGVAPVAVPAALVALIPPGPPLDPSAAKNFAGRAALTPGS